MTDLWREHQLHAYSSECVVCKETDRLKRVEKLAGELAEFIAAFYEPLPDRRSRTHSNSDWEKFSDALKDKAGELQSLIGGK